MLKVLKKEIYLGGWRDRMCTGQAILQTYKNQFCYSLWIRRRKGSINDKSCNIMGCFGSSGQLGIEIIDLTRASPGYRTDERPRPRCWWQKGLELYHNFNNCTTKCLFIILSGARGHMRLRWKRGGRCVQQRRKQLPLGFAHSNFFYLRREEEIHN